MAHRQISMDDFLVATTRVESDGLEVPGYSGDKKTYSDWIGAMICQRSISRPSWQRVLVTLMQVLPKISLQPRTGHHPVVVTSCKL